MKSSEHKVLPTEQVQGLLVWATELIAHEVHVTVDPVAVRRTARAVLQGQEEVKAADVPAALEQVLRDAQLVPAPTLDDVAGSLEKTELPIVSLANGGLAIASRRDGKLDVARPDGTRAWRTVAEARAEVEQHAGWWMTAAPAAPMENLVDPHAADGHDAHHRSPWSRVRALMGLERDDLWIVVIYAAAVGLFTLATPIAVQSLVSSVAFGTVLQPIVVLSLLLLVALGFQSGLKAMQDRVVEAIQQRVFARTALDLAWRLPRVKPEADGAGPEAVNRFFDVMTIQKTASILLTDGLSTVLQLAIGALVLGFYHPMLLAFDLVLIVLVAAVVFAPARRGLATSIDESYAKYDVAAWLQQLARPNSPFRSSSGAALALERADALTRRYLTARRTHFQVLFGQNVGALVLQVVASAALLGLGGWLVVVRELTLGQLIAAEIIVGAVTASIAKAGKLLDSAYDLLTAMDKVGHVIDLPIETPVSAEPIPGAGALHVRVEGVPVDGRPLHFEARPGEAVAVLVPPGHVLGEWLAGEQVPAEGHITFNQVETHRARSERLHEAVAVVRSTGLFTGSVLENVVVGRDRVSAQDVRDVLERVGLLDAVRALPDGLDTRLSEEGRPLDSTQVKRLLLARALVGQPRLVVLDTSLEGLAPTLRDAAWKALRPDRARWTLVALVSDADCASARGCDRVVSLSSSEAA